MSCQSASGVHGHGGEPLSMNVIRTGSEGKSSNGDTSSGANLGFPHFGGISSHFLF
ncbi:unnamed protein product [Staurois parvus]|uniref:Uncharacterized protein n=1 Tax=Staurois parvus TaxID=386267 RepID=A0ABN9FT14_9NEOB|nr:unnamed protein product [Staurois parvus]